MCETCGRQFKRKDKLREHMKRLHGGREKTDHQVHVGSSIVEDQQGTTTTTKFTPKVILTQTCHSFRLIGIIPIFYGNLGFF